MTGLSHFYFYICFFSVCVCLTMWECSYHGATCGSQKTTCTNWLSPPTLWILGMELRSAGFCGKNFYLLSHFSDYCSNFLQVKDGNGEIFPCQEELGELLLSVLNKEEQREIVCVCVWPCILSSTFSRWWVWEALGTSLPMEVTVLEFTSACCSGFRLRLSQSCSVRYHGTTSNDTKSWNKSIDSQSFNLIWNKEGWYQWCWGQEDRAWNIHISVCY